MTMRDRIEGGVFAAILIVGIPALMAAMTLTSELMSGTPLGGDNMIWLRVLAGFDFIYTVLAVVFIDIVLVG